VADSDRGSGRDVRLALALCAPFGYLAAEYGVPFPVLMLVTIVAVAAFAAGYVSALRGGGGA
jgi:hypothetical protein